MCVMMATGQTETSNAMLDLGYHQLAKEWGRAVSRILSAQIKNIVPMSSHTYKGIVFFKILTNNGLFCLFLSFPHHNSIKNRKNIHVLAWESSLGLHKWKAKTEPLSYGGLHIIFIILHLHVWEHYTCSLKAVVYGFRCLRSSSSAAASSRRSNNVKECWKSDFDWGEIWGEKTW